MSLSDINFFAILVIIIFNMILGMLWYSPKVFGTVWAREHNFSLTDLKATPWHYVGAILVSFVIAFVFAVVVNWLDIFTLRDGLKLGFTLWLGFIATTHFSGVLWAKKPLKVYFIDAGFQLISMLFMGAILTVWS